MSYRTKAERRAREAKLYELAREYAKAVKGAASQYTYSGSAYEHVAREFDQINARVVDVYLGRSSSDAGGES